MTQPILPVFIGGYTKSGTTLVGRAFGLLDGVYTRGEADYFRIFHDRFNAMVREFNINIQFVNKEVYDGSGTIRPLTENRMAALHRSLFTRIFFNDQPVPQDCRVLVEKSPRNIFHLDAIRFIFPTARVVCVYRDPMPTFRSLCRHMADHRSPAFNDPGSGPRRELIHKFSTRRWPNYVKIVEAERDNITIVRYDTLSRDLDGFMQFIQDRVIGRQLPLKAPVASLSKEAYLQSLPPERRKTSLVQTDSAQRITLSDEEKAILESKCLRPYVDFDF